MMKDTKDFIIAIVGMGAMGTGIAQHFAAAGHEVHAVVSQREGAAKRAGDMIAGSLKAMMDTGSMNAEEAEEVRRRVHYYVDLGEGIADADLIIESIPENKEQKIEMFRQIDSLCKKNAILCSNTSSLPVFDFLEVSDKSRLIITHFFVPAYAMPLVEIVRGPETSDEIVNTVQQLMQQSGKKTAVVNQCIPGFIVNRLTFALFREASYLVEQGICTPVDVDNAVTAIHGNRFSFEGPFGLVDMAGTATYRNICEYLFPALCDQKTVPAMLQQMVDDDRQGIKNGEGYYHWEDPETRRENREKRILKDIAVNAGLDREYPR